MKLINPKLRVILSSIISTLLICTPAWADDTEIYVGGTTSTSVKPNVLFILDTSGSMKEKDGGNISRMDRMKQSLTTVLNNAEGINVGLMRFTNPGGPVLYPVRYIDQVVSSGAVGSLPTGSVNVSINNGNDDAVQQPDTSVRVDSTLLEVLSPGSTTSITRTVSNSSDDAEQPLNDKANLNSVDLEMMYEGSTEQVLGVRFRQVDIPQNATITSAYLKFTVKTHYDGDLSVRIFGQDTNNAGKFKDNKNDLTDRNKTSAFADWVIADANDPASGEQMQSADISSIVQEIVNRNGWSANNKMAFLLEKISGSKDDKRQFHSFESTNTDNYRPQLYIEYSTGSDAGEAQTIGLRFNNVTVPQGATITSARIKLTAGASNTNSATLTFKGELAGQSTTFAATDGNLSGRNPTVNSVGWIETTAWTNGSVYTSPELATIANEIVGLGTWCGGNSITFLVESNGQRVIQAFENDIDKAAQLEISYDTSTVADGACSYQKYSYNITSSSDDAEQNGSDMQLTSSDLDLGQKKVGLRYNSIPLAKGATLSNAYIEFTADAGDSGATALTIKGHKTANPTAFTSSNNNISGRTPKTSASISWSPDTWNQAGETNQTPNIASIINELTAQDGWTSGNSLAFIIEGSGQRRSESYDSSNLAPRLVFYAKPSDISAIVGTVRQEIIDAVQSLPNDGWTPIVDTLYEAARYYRGEALEYGDSRGTGVNKELKRLSHPGSYTPSVDIVVRPSGCSADNPGSNACAGEYIGGDPVYISPITDSCQANYIVLLTDGEANNNHSAQLIKDMIPGATSCVGNSNVACGIELLSYLHNEDQDPDGLAQSQTIKSYTIGLEIDNSWLTDLANAGGGSYFPVESSSQLTNAFDTIIKTIRASNSTFVQPSVTINQFNRFAHRDDVYFSLFKPQGTPKWFGNLKKYQLKGSPATLYDNRSPQQPAIDPLTGFFGIESRSFWSVDEDGNQVERGGAASMLPNSRKIYSNVSSSAVLSVTENTLSESNPLLTNSLLKITDDIDSTPLLQWARGLDANGAQRYELGDPLHSRPELVTYSSNPDNNTVESSIFFGTNEGFLHAVDINTGIEQFAFIPKELLGNLNTFFVNTSADSRPYGMDGGITLWTKDADKNGSLTDPGDHAYLYIGMRRGGRNYYALDVTDINNPELMWQIDGGSEGFEALGQTWSRPVKSKVIFDNVQYDVLIFGGGYDTNQDNVSVRTTDSLGNAVYIVNALTGAKIWSAGTGTGHNETPTGMDYSIPSEIRVLDMNQDGIADQLYVGDMGGQLWRFDIYNTDNDNQLKQSVDVTRIADLGGNDAASNRRFYYPPDLALAVDGKKRYLSLAIGSGFRAHPLNTAIDDRFYMIKLFDTHAKPSSWTTLTEDDLYDATSNDIGGSEATLKTAAQAALSNTDVDRKQGWFLRMVNNGEKVLSGSTTIQNQIVFTSYEPTPPETGSCNPAQGTSRAYLVSLFDATPIKDIDEDGSITADDRVIQLQIGSIPATPTIIDTIDSKPTVWVGPERLDQVNTDVESTRTYWIEETN